MTAEQSLVGAMGCASWRAHYRLREYAELAPQGGIIRSGGGTPVITSPAALGLNEVGVTDAVMATMWRLGPRAAAYAVSPGAESNHLGADIAIVHSATARVLVYQAKLAHLDVDMFILKSAVGASHVRLLRRRSVTLDGIRHAVTGRLGLYQIDATPFIGRCHEPLWFEWWDRWRWEWTERNSFSGTPDASRRYYEEVLSPSGCSPSGILAAPIAGREAMSSVTAASTWPWEFDTYEWLQQSGSPRDSPPTSGPGGQSRLTQRPPEFEPYRPIAAPAEPTGDVRDLARQLANQLRLGATHQLYVIRI